jgi:hypothetical protein
MNSLLKRKRSYWRIDEQACSGAVFFLILLFAGLIAQFGLERFPDTEEVTGSNPVGPTTGKGLLRISLFYFVLNLLIL